MRIVSLCLSLRDLRSKSWQSKKSKIDGCFASLVCNDKKLEFSQNLAHFSQNLTKIGATNDKSRNLWRKWANRQTFNRIFGR
ncbi:hypothetical protein ACWIUD_06320 [Helicobacter sp. 23-1044]